MASRYKGIKVNARERWENKARKQESPLRDNSSIVEQWSPEPKMSVQFWLIPLVDNYQP